MANNLDPIPYDQEQGSFAWVDWFVKLRALINGLSTDHNDLTNIQGGQANEYYHLTASEHAGLTVNLDETIDDRVAALLVAGSGIELFYDDPANTLTIVAPNRSYFPSGW